MTAPPRVGVSACLLGQEVRHDGGHKRDQFLVSTLAPYVEWVPVCPEVELGLGTPREAIRLFRREDGAIRLVTVKGRVDLTDRMHRYASRRVRDLAGDDLSGYILKKDSPSCGMERVKVWSSAGMPARNGRGLFADALIRAHPALPVEEEGRLNDARIRDNFIERLFAYQRLTTFLASRWTLGRLVAFHTAHKLTLMAHSPAAYRELGQLVATAKSLSRAEALHRYREAFMTGMSKIASPGRHANVLQHMLGYLRRRLDDADRRELGGLVDDYRRGFVPLVVPLTLFRHHVERLDVAYLKGQLYLDPHPKELMLRNHV